jgi:glycine C-acetyltransferase
MRDSLRQRLSDRLNEARDSGTLKAIRAVEGPIGAHASMAGAGDTLMFASNDYLALANDAAVVAAARAGLDAYGAGTAGARFVCGTTPLHLAFEQELAAFFGKDAAVTVSSGFAANLALLPAIARPGDAIVSDELNHASLIDGGRMTPQGVARAIYPHSDMAALENLLRQHAGAGERFIVIDGVFSMEGDLARLDRIVALAGQHAATVIVDDAHGIGTVGTGGRGTAAHYKVDVDIVTGSLGKALAGAAGGFIAGPRELIENVTQFARPQLFSTSLPAATICASRAALRRLVEDPGMAQELSEKTNLFRGLLTDRGLAPLVGTTPIVVLMIGDTRRAIAMTALLAVAGVFAVAFGYPVVPEGKARLRLQVSRGHTAADLQRAADLLAKAYVETGEVT